MEAKIWWVLFWADWGNVGDSSRAFYGDEQSGLLLSPPIGRDGQRKQGFDELLTPLPHVYAQSGRDLPEKVPNGNCKLPCHCIPKGEYTCAASRGSAHSGYLLWRKLLTSTGCSLLKVFRIVYNRRAGKIAVKNSHHFLPYVPWELLRIS